MNTIDRAGQEDMERRLRLLLIEVADQLAPITVALVGELIEASEAPIALDMLSDMLVERQARVTAAHVDEIAALAKELGLGPATSRRLLPLVESDPQT